MGLTIDRPVITIARLPFGDLEPGVLHPGGELAADRHLDPDEVNPGTDEGGRFAERRRDVGLAQRHAKPRPTRLAEDPDRLAADGPLGIDPLDGSRHQSRRFRLGDDPPIVLAEQFALERQVDGARRDVDGELLRVEVVLEQGHREGQGDTRAEDARIRHEPSVDGRAGQRTSGRIERR